jgi:catechol 2,3-dioxygenase-like lactoylglutathione lyase family enzyme
MKIDGVLETCLYATDLPAAERFYTSVLGLEVISREPGRHVFFRTGRGVFLLFNSEHTSAQVTNVAGVEIPLHGTRGAGHVAFAVTDSSLPTWQERLQQAGIAIEAEVRWPGGGHSFYFRDPAGNSVELATPRLWGLEDGTQ